MAYCGVLSYRYSALMDKLTPAQTQSLLRQLLQAPPSSLLSSGSAQSAQVANAYGKGPMAGSSLSLQLPPALRQLVAQAQSPAQLLQSLHTMRDQPDLPANVRALIQQVLSQAVGTSPQTQITPALVSAWFGLNPASALLQPGALLAPQTSPQNTLWLQQALPLMLLLLRPQTGAQTKSSPALAQALGQLFGAAGQSTAGLGAGMSQLLRDLQGALQHVRISQVLYADTAARNEPDYFLTLPWQVGDESRMIELLLKKRQQ